LLVQEHQAAAAEVSRAVSHNHAENSMKHRFLEVTYRKGKPVAAYLYLPRRQGDKSSRTARHGPGLVVDYTADDRAIGIEITAPSAISLADINAALESAKQEPVTADDVAPLVSFRPAAPA
jgi:hypothetical protein